MRRFRQTHDVWHALADLGTAGHEEVILHAFSWGQLRLPVSAMAVRARYRVASCTRNSARAVN